MAAGRVLWGQEQHTRHAGRRAPGSQKAVKLDARRLLRLREEAKVRWTHGGIRGEQTGICLNKSPSSTLHRDLNEILINRAVNSHSKHASYNKIIISQSILMMT